MNCSRKGRKGREPYFVPHARDFEGRPQRAGPRDGRGGMILGVASWLEPFRLGLNLTSVTLILADEPALAGIPADELRMDLACGMYREGKITSVTAAHLAGVGIVRFQEELRNRSIPRAYDTEDLESDLAFLRSPLAA